MTNNPIPASAARLFGHVTAEKADTYRAILDAFAAAKRQFRLHLRPDEVLFEAAWPDEAPAPDALQLALDQLVDWGNLQAQVDTSRVATLEDFYRRRLLYRMTPGGEAVETGLRSFVAALRRRAELQSVALDDILARLVALGRLARKSPPDAARLHAELRDLVNVFDGLANNAEAFMAGLERTIELQRADLAAVMSFKSRLIDYLQRFIGELVTRSSQIADEIAELAPLETELLRTVAEREARDAAPGDAAAEVSVVDERLADWRERWAGLRRWFMTEGQNSQAALLRKSALAAIPRLLQAVSLLNERRSGRSDRAADFRQLALWFAETDSDASAHRLWRAAFALSPARHLALTCDEDCGATTPWKDAPRVDIQPQLRERGALPTRGAMPKIRDRSRERELLAARMEEEVRQTEAARRRLATGRELRLSELGRLNRHEFRLFLALLGDALAAQLDPEQSVERQTTDGSLAVRLEPLGVESQARLETELGTFSGRDHRIIIRSLAPT